MTIDVGTRFRRRSMVKGALFGLRSLVAHPCLVLFGHTVGKQLSNRIFEIDP